MRFLLPALLISLVFSCSSTDADKTSSDSVKAPVSTKIDFKKGDITDLTVNGDPENIFSVYLPASYDSTKKYPVVFFFDAHADGKLPINNYKSIAEKWNYIFIGSNTSKNGLASDYTMKIGNELINTVKNILPVDTTEIILCGFSGGARVASNIAMFHSDVKALICNSAAPQQPLNDKIFIGLAGLGDMNYLEMKKFQENQADNNSPHELLVFDGKHEWAPAAMMEDALMMTAMFPLNGKNNPNSNEMYRDLGIQVYRQSDSIKKTSCMIAHNLLEAGKRAQEAALKGNQRIILGDDYRISVKADACAAADKKTWKDAETQETVLQQELASAMMSQDTTWWKNNSAHYFESNKPDADKFMHERLRGYASLMAYSYANQAFKSNNLHAAEKLIAIYAIVDPTNSEWAYMQAQLYVKIGMNDYAFGSLEKAVTIGFNDKQRMQNDPVFAGLISDPRFAAVLGKMK
jgi:pimeloyl-ACP methyl ester carboxylesterase